MSKVNKDFNPDIFQALYIIRRGLYKGIVKYAGQLNGRLMDFGCGSKPYKSLFKNASEYIGVDYDSEGHSHKNEKIDVFYDGKTIPFKDNSFDSILTSEVLEHVFNLEEILKELNRVLKPGGKILITIPFAWYEHEVPNDFGRYTSFGIKSLLEKNGFIILELDKTGNFIETLTQMWIVYWHTHVIPKFRPFARLIGALFYFLSNVFGLAAARVFPKKHDYYLNLIILATKQNN